MSNPNYQSNVKEVEQENIDKGLLEEPEEG